MSWYLDILYQAIKRIFSFDARLYEIVSLTLKVSLTALLIATLLALPVAAWLALNNKRRHRFIIIIINTMMGFPPILAGLLVYLLLSRHGLLGILDLLFSPSAMIFAQILLIFPIICGLSQQVFRRKYHTLSDLFYTLGIKQWVCLKTIIYETRHQLLGAIVTGLGRGLAEVGAVMIAGGNILHYTRTITTSIALETSKGEIANSVSLGIILLIIALLINVLLFIVNDCYAKTISSKF